MVHVGDQVKKGDILVSGRIEVCNDAKEVVEYQYEQADADIRADTQTDMRMKSAHTMKKRGIRTKNGCRFCGI